MSLFTKMISGLNGSEGFDALSTAIGLVILTIVSVYVLFQVPAVASNFGSGVSADIASAARHAAGHSMNTMGNVASNGIFGGAAFSKTFSSWRRRVDKAPAVAAMQGLAVQV